MAKGTNLIVRVSKEEKESFESEAEKIGITVSAYVRTKLGSGYSIEAERLESLIYQLQEDNANRIENLETKIQENQRELLNNLSDFGKSMDTFLTTEFAELRTSKPAKEAQIDELVNDKSALNAKMFATTYYIGDRIYTNTGKLYEVIQNGEDAYENKAPNSIKVKEVETGKVGPLSLNSMQTTIIKIARFKKNIEVF